MDAVKRREAQAAEEGVAVDYGLHIGIKDPSGDLLDSMQEAIEYGVSSFKVFMVYDFGVSDGVFYKVLEKAKQYGALIAVHA